MMEEEYRKAEEEAKSMPNPRQAEQQALEQLLKTQGYSVNEIAADGHCMFNAIADQLQRVTGKHMSFQALRNLASDYMTAHPNDFMPFMTDDQGNLLDQDGFHSYCEKLKREPVWGGQLELQALSQQLKQEIHVFQVNSPLICIGEEFKSDSPLRVSYHRHAYGLGEHYNSIIPLMTS